MPEETPNEPIQVLLCGCGNAVHVLTSYMGQQSHAKDFKVNVISLGHCESFVDQIPEDGLIRCVNDMGKDTYGKANRISSDPAEVVPGSKVILFALPTDRHELYLKAMLPYIEEGTLIGSMPGEGGFDLCVRNVLGPELSSKCTLFAMETLPWACRTQTFGKVVQVLGTKKDIEMCVYPMEQCAMVRDLVQNMIGPVPVVDVRPTSNFLECSLMNPNGIAHPSIMYGLLRNWDGTSVFPEKPLFYQALDDYAADTMEGVSNEILDVKEAILKLYPSCDLSLVRSMEQFFLDSYQDDIADKSSLKMMFVSNKGYDGLTMPTQQVEGGYLPLFDHRYFTEDLPCGILIQKGIAELAGVPTPIMDKVITWCQEKAGNKEYLVDGKLTGKDIAFTKTPQRYGYTDLKTFMEENGYT